MASNVLRLAILRRVFFSLLALLSVGALGWGLAGCGSDKVAGPNRPVPMTLVAVGGGTAASRFVARAASVAAADTDSVTVTFTKALLVVRDVRFVRPEGLDDDNDEADSLGENDSLDVEHDDEDGGQVIFRGPFVLDALSGHADRLDTLMVMPGDFVRVQGHLQPLRAGDADAAANPDLVGYTVWIEGTIADGSSGTFSFRTRIDDEFQIRGAFHVAADTPATAFLVFDPAKWLKTPDGHFLDPRDPANEAAIKSAIRHAIKVGVDKDHDGELDHDEERDAD